MSLFNFFILTAWVVFCGYGKADANFVKFAWNPNPEPDISHYVITYGTESGNRTQSVNTGNVTTYTVGGLENSTTYYFALQAVNTSGLISLPTDEISHTTAAPPPSTGILVLPRNDWSITVSSELGSRFLKNNAIDGKAETYWHSQRSADVAPHWLAIDLGSRQEVKGFRFTPRRPEDDTFNQARLNEWKLYLSDDGKTWGEAIAQGAFPNDTEIKEYLLPEAITARHLKVEMLSAHGEPPPYAWAVAEFYVLVVDPDFETPPYTPSPPMDMTGATVYSFSSQETIREDTPAEYVLSEDMEKFWHTDWDNLPPHYITIKLRTNATVSAFWYWPRGDGGINGNIIDYEIETSIDGDTWEFAAKGTWQVDASPKLAQIPLREIRYVKLWTTDRYASAAHIALSGDYVPEPPKTIVRTVQHSLDLKTWTDLLVLPDPPPANGREFLRFKIESP